ncbi:hypothetical protein QFZ75_008015 [Streptomyces sp. V3I8]|uniref:hypothetical protein n=1 Tax=Streptomyces sp. V3I8 TaxID=3042279 RepID=UPI0027887426|nr:hypothetical protein [Streptomyces sp. V3I8]MDQ1041513.1 hypothetical protein [Streptomyces sp. V3I8]
MSSRQAYTVVSNPMPGPLLAAMSSLKGATVAPEDAYSDAQGHHLIARKGSVVVHATLALDHYADGVDWADGDMAWAVTRDGAPVDCIRWSDVVTVVREAPEEAPVPVQQWPAKGDVITMSTVPGVTPPLSFTGIVTFTPADGWHELSVDYAPESFDAHVSRSKFPGVWTWEYAGPMVVEGVTP